MIISYHFSICLGSERIIWGLCPFTFEDKYLSADGFGAKVEQWWKSNEVNGKASFKLVHKLKL